MLRAVLVDVRRVLGQYVFEMVPVEDQYPIQQLAAEGADPAFGDRVRSGRPHRCTQDADAFAGEHGIEGAGELGIPIPDQELVKPPHARRGPSVDSVSAEQPRLGSGSGDAEKVHAAGGVLHKEQDREPLEQQRARRRRSPWPECSVPGRPGTVARWGRHDEVPGRYRLASGSTTPCSPQSGN
jgi:hypothetical protein